MYGITRSQISVLSDFDSRIEATRGDQWEIKGPFVHEVNERPFIILKHKDIFISHDTLYTLSSLFLWVVHNIQRTALSQNSCPDLFWFISVNQKSLHKHFLPS